MTNSVIDPRPNFIQTVMIDLISQLINPIHIRFLNLYFLNPFLDLLVQSLDLFQCGIVQLLKQMTLMLTVHLTLITLDRYSLDNFANILRPLPVKRSQVLILPQQPRGKKLSLLKLCFNMPNLMFKRIILSYNALHDPQSG